MSEELKCPCCGSPMEETYLGYVCCNTSLEDPCSFRVAKHRLSRIAAAMELAKAVAWERECAEFDKWANDNCQGSYEWDNVVYCATLEVDRLLATD